MEVFPHEGVHTPDPNELGGTVNEARQAALAGCEAVLFDLDGVLTPTAEVHMYAWRSMFTALFAQLGTSSRYSDDDYYLRLDGKPRYAGVADVLAFHGIELPWGEPSDPPTALTVCGVGNRKNEEFERVLNERGVEPFPGSVAFLDALAARGVLTAVVSSSRNARPVLAAAALTSRFPVIVDGILAAEEGLAGKPAPDTYLRAAQLLGVPPERTAIAEDAVSGVRAGAAGSFAVVVGVDRGAGEQALREAGATVVVHDLAELVAEAEEVSTEGRHAR